MSKTVASPVEKYPGNVVLPDALTYMQGIHFGQALRKARALGEDVSMAEFIYAMLPGILACVEEWHIDGLPAEITQAVIENAKPARAVAELLAWLFPLCSDLWVDAEAVPNA
jgi:hypothetical protein